MPDRGAASTRRIGRRRRIALLLACALVLLGFTVRRPAMVAVADFLDVGKEPVRADLLFVLGGDVHNRPAAAAEIYRQGLVPKIAIPQVAENLATELGLMPLESEVARQLLIRLGVPDSAIVVLSTPGGVASTTDEAVLLREFVVREGIDEVMALTSDYHTRRARWNLRRQIDDLAVDLTVVGAPDPRFTARDWWRSEPGMIAYAEEYLKFLHNLAYR